MGCNIMGRLLQIGSVLLLVVGASYGANRQESKESPKPPSKPAPAKPAPPKAGVPKAGIPKGAARLVNPSNPAVRLFRMTPEEREHALEKLPTEQARENARKMLEWFDSMPKETQELQLRRLDRFAQLTPEKRAEVKKLEAEVNQLPQPRKEAVGRALARLQQMNDIPREVTLQRPGFQAQFSPEEFRIISGLADAWMGPLQ
jgi:Protein of unknown function (DUF3106)